MEQAWPNGKVELVSKLDQKKCEERDDVAFIGFEYKSDRDERSQASTQLGLWMPGPASKIPGRNRIFFAEFLGSGNVEFDVAGEPDYTYPLKVPQTTAYVSCGPAFLATYLRIAMDALEKKKVIDYSDKINNMEPLKKLAHLPLIVCNYSFTEPGAYSSDPAKLVDPKKIFKGYPYVYKCLTPDEANDFMLTSKQNCYFMTVTLAYGHGYTTIYDFSEAKIIFQDDSGSLYNIIKYLKKVELGEK